MGVDMSDDTAPSGDHHLYRWYDHEGLLLYVGITNNLRARTTAHWSQSWWTQFAAVVDWNPSESGTRDEVQRREVAAIIAERPVFNSTASPAARQRTIGYLVERGVDPLEHVSTLPAHTRLNVEPIDCGVTAQRVNPVRPEEILRRGGVHAHWPKATARIMPMRTAPAVPTLSSGIATLVTAPAKDPDAWGCTPSDEFLMTGLQEPFPLPGRFEGNPVLETLANEFARYFRRRGEPPVNLLCLAGLMGCGSCMLCADWAVWRRIKSGQPAQFMPPGMTLGCRSLDPHYDDACGRCGKCWASIIAGRRSLLPEAEERILQVQERRAS
jgi:hypothetical protein